MIGADRFIDKLDAPSQAKHATQRYLRGFSDIDMWNFDRFLADVIVAGCDWCIQHGKTSPWHLPDDQWKAILWEIRDGFAATDGSGAPKPPESAWETLRNNFKHFWD